MEVSAVQAASVCTCSRPHVLAYWQVDSDGLPWEGSPNELRAHNNQKATRRGKVPTNNCSTVGSPLPSPFCAPCLLAHICSKLVVMLLLVLVLSTVLGLVLVLLLCVPH